MTTDFDKLLSNPGCFFDRDDRDYRLGNKQLAASNAGFIEIDAGAGRAIVLKKRISDYPKEFEWSKIKFSPLKPVIEVCEDQGSAPMCVAFAICAALQARKNVARKPLDGYVRLSESHVWRRIKDRNMDGLGPDRGTFPSVALKLIKDEGVCYQNEWPNFDDHPATSYEQVAASAIKNKFEKYSLLLGRDALKFSVSNYGPVPVSFLASESWFGDAYSITKNRGAEFGHEVMVCDYYDHGVRFANSWGVDWGMGGYGYMTWDYFDKYCQSAYQLIDLEMIDKDSVENDWVLYDKKALLWYVKNWFRRKLKLA